MTKAQRDFFNLLMELYEFEVYRSDNGKLMVDDLQGACLGDICSEQFDDEFEILERMEIYHNDYIMRPIEDEYDISFNTYEEWYEFLKDKNESTALQLISMLIYKKLPKEMTQ